MNKTTDRDIQAFMARVHIEPNGCWTWQGGLSSARVAQFNVGGRRLTAARWIYQKTHGELPRHRYVHRTCGGRLCVNPDHQRAGPKNAYKNRPGPHLRTIPKTQRALKRRVALEYRIQLEREAYARKKARLGARCEVCGAVCSERDRRRCKACCAWNGAAHKAVSPDYLKHQHEAWKARREFEAKRRRSAS